MMSYIDIKIQYNFVNYNKIKPLDNIIKCKNMFIIENIKHRLGQVILYAIKYK